MPVRRLRRLMMGCIARPAGPIASGLESLVCGVSYRIIRGHAIAGLHVRYGSSITGHGLRVTGTGCTWRRVVKRCPYLAIQLLSSGGRYAGAAQQKLVDIRLYVFLFCLASAEFPAGEL